jgi:hypothetical protein
VAAALAAAVEAVVVLAVVVVVAAVVVVVAAVVVGGKSHEQRQKAGEPNVFKFIFAKAFPGIRYCGACGSALPGRHLNGKRADNDYVERQSVCDPARGGERLD